MGANVINIGLTQLLLGPLLCCVRGPRPPPGAHSGAAPLGCLPGPGRPPRRAPGLVMSASHLSDTDECEAIPHKRRGPLRRPHSWCAERRRNTKSGPLWVALRVRAGQRRGGQLGTCEEKRGPSKGSRVPYTDEIIGCFTGGAGLGQGSAKQEKARKESQGHNTMSGPLESWAGSEGGKVGRNNRLSFLTRSARGLPLL